MYEIIVSPYRAEGVVLRPGSRKALRIHRSRYLELIRARECPTWLAESARSTWGVDLAAQPVADTAVIREPASLGFVRATHEVNLGCNYECEHCYLGLKRFEGMSWPDRLRMLMILREAGVLWLQLTGGEPTIDKLFPEVYACAFDMGMMISILSNGSHLHIPALLELLTTRPPQRITISVYGGSEASYDGLTRRRGAFKAFTRGLAAGAEAGLPLALSLIITRHNAHELDAMKALADRYGLPRDEYTNMAPTIYGGAESLPAQSVAHLRKRKPFTGCNAGHTFFHVDPHGKASICKIGREPAVDLLTEGVEGLRRLNGIADSLLLRQGGCTGCQLQGTCGTCMPLVQLYRKAKAPLASYCQHGHPREEVNG